MEEGARIDYFRSEIKGEIARLEKLLADHRATTAAALKAIEDRFDKVVRDLKHLEMSLQ